MAFIPVLKSPWTKKNRTLAWKAKAAVLWLFIVCALWLAGYFFLMLLLLPTDPIGGGAELGRRVGQVLGFPCGFFLITGWIFIFTRPSIK